MALRRALWLATDRAYKAASQALSSKKAALSQFAADQPFDDFAHTQPLQSMGPLAKLTFDPKTWTDMLVKSSAQFKTDPKLEQLSAQLRFRAMNRYFANSEGTVTRQGYEVDALDHVRFHASCGRHAPGPFAHPSLPPSWRICPRRKSSRRKRLAMVGTLKKALA